MIYFEGLESIIESIYLDDELGNKLGECSVFVNPEYIKYLSGKVVIVNSPYYPAEKIIELLGNGNTVVSRIEQQDIEKLIIQPYILRINPSIQYSGKIIKNTSQLEFKTILQDYCVYNEGVLYFPKLYGLPKETLIDQSENLTGIGWACQQVGINIKEDTEFHNLDILKLRKIRF